MKQVLVPLDGTKRAEATLAKLGEFCTSGAEVTLLAVKKPDASPRSGFTPGVVTTASGMPGTGPDIPKFAETQDQTLQKEVDLSKDYLEGLAEPLRAGGYRVATEVLIDEKPDAAIIRYARQMQPAFIVMIRRTHPRISELLFGSVASAVVHANVASVMFVPEA